MIIRKAFFRDQAQLETLFQFTRKATFSDRPTEKFQIGEYAKSTAEDEVWVCEKNNSIVGFIPIYTADNFIHNLFVHPDYQNQKIGTQLLKMAESHLCSPMTLKIALDNLKAFRFYEKPRLV